MRRLYQFYIVFVCQLTITVSLPVIIQHKQFHLQQPQNVQMSFSIEPDTGPSAIPCLATIRVSPVLPLEIVTSFAEDSNSAAPSICVSFSDCQSDVMPSGHLIPKIPRKPVILPYLPIIETSPTITNPLKVVPLTKANPPTETVPNITNPKPLIENSLSHVTACSKNIQEKEIRTDRDEISLRNIKDRRLNIKQDNLPTNFQTTLSMTLDKSQFATNSFEDVLPDSISPLRKPSSVTTILPRTNDCYSLPVNNLLKARTDSASIPKSNELLPSVNTIPSSSFLPNLSLPFPLQSKKRLTTDIVTPPASQKPTPVAPPIQTSLETNKKLSGILKSYENVKSSKSTSINNTATPDSIRAQSSVNRTEKASSTSINADLIPKNRLLSTPVTTQDKFNILKSASLVSKMSNLETNSVNPLTFERNSLNTYQTENVIMPSNSTINPSNSIESLNSLISYPYDTASKLNYNNNLYNDIPLQFQSEKSFNISAKNPTRQTNFIKDNFFSQLSYHNLNTHPNFAPKKSETGLSVSHSLPGITLPDKDTLSMNQNIETKSIPYAHSVTNDFLKQTIFPSVHSKKQNALLIDAGRVKPNIESTATLQNPEITVKIPSKSNEASELFPISTPVNFISSFDLSPPYINAPSFLPKPELTNLPNSLISTSDCYVFPLIKESSSNFVDTSNSLTSSMPYIRSIIINIIPYIQETSSEIIIII